MIARSEAIEALAGAHFEVLVIGGGITGAGVALDAASRGYSVALLEARDYAIGTSSRSSKMVHGGLRYLQNLDLGLVREALLERQLMVRLAPHLVYPTPFLVPTLAEEKIDRKIGIGLNMYDVMATTRVGRGRRGRSQPEEPESAEAWAPDRHRTIGPEEVTELVPALAACEPRSAYLFYDCQTDDVRLVLSILGEAERLGAVLLNGAEVEAVGDPVGRASKVAFREEGSGERIEVSAGNVVNATGVWADRIRPGELAAEEDIPRISPSRGSHLLVGSGSLSLDRAACVVPAGEGRGIFALPWHGRTLIGTTDEDYRGELERVATPDQDIEYLLGATNAFFGTSLGASDLQGAFAGVRPLISTGDPRKSVDISRKAELYETSSGMLTITGGKLTTWRRMAQLTVDRIVEREGRKAPCVTDQIPLGMPASEFDLQGGLGEEVDAHLASRYGRKASAVLAVAAAEPALAEPIAGGLPDILAEAVIAAREEQVRCLADFLLRRSRAGILAAPALRDRERLARVAGVLGRELNWSESRIAAELDAWEGLVRDERLDPGRAAA